MNRVLIVLTIFCYSCTQSAQLRKGVTLYSDSAEVSVETVIPQDWMKYDVPDFKNGNFLLLSAYGTKDSSRMLVVDVRKSLMHEDLKSWIEDELANAKSSYTGVHLMELKVADPTEQYQLAFFDYYTKGNDRTYYSETIAFQKNGYNFIIRVSTTGDEDAFKDVANLIRENLRY